MSSAAGIRKILLVEDDEFFREAVAHVLRRRGYEVFVAVDGESARRFFETSEVHLVLSDTQLPGMNGLELLKWLKGFKDVPFLLMSGYANVLEGVSVRELGACELLTKPFKNADLIEAIARAEKRL